MTADRERILEILRKLFEERPDLRAGQIVEFAANRGGGVPFYVDDRDFLYGLLDMRKGKP